MIHDPTDETHRKKRRLTNTPLKKYIRRVSLFVTLCYAGAMYISYRRHCCGPEILKEFEDSLTEEQKFVVEEFKPIVTLRDTIQQLFEREKIEIKTETKSNDMQTNL